MDYEEFESELWNVAVSKEHIERDTSDSEKWEKIRENFDEEKLVENIHFSDVEDVKFQRGSRFPNVKIQVDNEWKRLFFLQDESAEDCFKKLRYKLNVFRQKYQ